MRLPTSVQEKLVGNFSKLLDELEEAKVDGRYFVFAEHVDFVRLQQKALMLLAQLQPYHNSQVANSVARIEQLEPVVVYDFEKAADFGEKYSDFDELRGLVRAVKESLEADMLGNLADLIISAVSADYMDQAGHLLEARFHVPAATLIGGVLEDALRRLCSAQTPEIPLLKPTNRPKTLNDLIDDLKSVNVFSEFKAKQLRAWAAIRNNAAHGTTSEITEKDVKLMHQAVETFLAEHL